MSTHLQPGDVVAGYRIEEPVARGGMAVVYLARHLRLNRKVALKVLAPELARDEQFRKRFIRESELAASIDHPNIVPIFEASQSGDLLYIAMRYVEGRDFHRLLQDEGPLSVERTVSLLRQVAHALDAAHRRGLVHRDVKPGNILVSSQGRTGTAEHVYVTDFGLTKRTDSVSGFTQAGNFMGTIDYVAPEQIRGERVDHRADVYALGCVLFRALTGLAPFQRESDAAVIYAHLSHRPPPLSGLDPALSDALDAAITRALAKQASERPSTCGELVDDLERAAAGATSGSLRERLEPTGAATVAKPWPQPASTAAPVGRPSGRARSRHFLALLVVVALGLTLGVLGWSSLRNTRAGGEATATLSFPGEVHDPAGVRVIRRWTLDGRNGDRLVGELTVSTRGATRITLVERLPRAMGAALAHGRFTPGPEGVDDGNAALSYLLDTTRPSEQVLRYELNVPPGAVTVERLQQWAKASASTSRSAKSGSRVRVVHALALAPSPLEMTAHGTPHLLRLTGTYSGGDPVPEELLGGPRWVSGDPSIATVSASGVVTPHRAGRAVITAQLGRWQAAAVIVVTA